MRYKKPQDKSSVGLKALSINPGANLTGNLARRGKKTGKNQKTKWRCRTPKEEKKKREPQKLKKIIQNPKEQAIQKPKKAG